MLYRVGLIIYRLYFHPLAKFPGPKLYAASGLPFYYADKLRGDFYKRAGGLHERYGTFVRVTPDRLLVEASVSNPEILGRAAARGPEFGKTFLFYGVDRPVGIASAVKDDHRRQRRLLAHAFSESALREQVSSASACVSMLGSIPSSHGGRRYY